MSKHLVLRLPKGVSRAEFLRQLGEDAERMVLIPRGDRHWIRGALLAALACYGLFRLVLAAVLWFCSE